MKLSQTLLRASGYRNGIDPPFVRAVGAATDSSNNVTPAVPTHEAGDILLFFSWSSTLTSLSELAGWTAVGVGNAWWLRATSSSTPPPTSTSTADKNIGYIISVGGCIASGNPVEAMASASSTVGAGASGTFPAITTLGDNRLVIGHYRRGGDRDTGALSSLVNANLEDLSIRGDYGTIIDSGGGVGAFSGIMRSAGNTGETSFVNALNVSSGFPRSTFALKPME